MTSSIILLAAWLIALFLARRQFFHIALLGFPGVVLHEAMHLIIGVVLLAKPVSFNIFPRRSGNQWQFGSVSFTGLNLVNSAPVALAPLLLLGLAWLLFAHWMLPLFQNGHYLEWVLSGYVTACAVFYSPPSTTDLRVGGWSILAWALLSLGIGWLWRHSGIAF